MGATRQIPRIARVGAGIGLDETARTLAYVDHLVGGQAAVGRDRVGHGLGREVGAGWNITGAGEVRGADGGVGCLIHGAREAGGRPAQGRVVADGRRADCAAAHQTRVAARDDGRGIDLARCHVLAHGDVERRAGGVCP